MSKCKFQITIEETVSDVFYLEAENFGEAIEIAQRKYKSGEFILSPGNLISKQMAITAPIDESTEWVEF